MIEMQPTKEPVGMIRATRFPDPGILDSLIGDAIDQIRSSARHTPFAVSGVGARSRAGNQAVVKWAGERVDVRSPQDEDVVGGIPR